MKIIKVQITGKQIVYYDQMVEMEKAVYGEYQELLKGGEEDICEAKALLEVHLDLRVPDRADDVEDIGVAVLEDAEIEDEDEDSEVEDASA